MMQNLQNYFSINFTGKQQKNKKICDKRILDPGKFILQINFKEKIQLVLIV